MGQASSSNYAEISSMQYYIFLCFPGNINITQLLTPITHICVEAKVTEKYASLNQPAAATLSCL